MKTTHSLIKPTILLLPIILAAACGEPLWQDADSSPASAAPAAPASQGLDEYLIGECEAEYGCLSGFISHGLSIVVVPEKSSNSAPMVDGEVVVLDGKKFRDAQDFGDRFDREFLFPLIPEELRGDYVVTISPKVTRDNFAAGFELYSEGITNVSGICPPSARVSMSS